MDYLFAHEPKPERNMEVISLSLPLLHTYQKSPSPVHFILQIPLILVPSSLAPLPMPMPVSGFTGLLPWAHSLYPPDFWQWFFLKANPTSLLFKYSSMDKICIPSMDKIRPFMIWPCLSFLPSFILFIHQVFNESTLCQALF